MPKSWYTIKAAADDSTAEISIFDAIGATWDGEGVTAKQFIADLRAIKAPSVTLSINSPGGSLFDGVAIYNALKSHAATVTAKVMGVAASAASVIAMGADRIEMGAGTFMMVHKSASVTWGNADEMRATADWLDKIDMSMGAIYVARTGKTADEVAALLSDETWFTADEAVEAGFADAVIEGAPVTAKFELNKLPANVQAAFKAAPAPAPRTSLTEQVEAAAKAAGLEAYAAVFALDPELTTATAVHDAIAQAREIQALAKVAGKPELASGLITSRKTVADARAVLIDARAASDRHTDNTQPPESKTPAASGEARGPSSFWAAKAA